ncbi:MAG: hypothetical protein LBD60_01490 [Puniceicoccales bacterium]|jgi:hypothetical protein|nr:hypothetical protein [Puniceicoccales bacterium]
MGALFASLVIFRFRESLIEVGSLREKISVEGFETNSVACTGDNLLVGEYFLDNNRK